MEHNLYDNDTDDYYDDDSDTLIIIFVIFVIFVINHMRVKKKIRPF